VWRFPLQGSREGEKGRSASERQAKGWGVGAENERTDVHDEDQEPVSLPVHLPARERILPNDPSSAVLSPRSGNVFVEREPGSGLVSERLDGRAFEDLRRGTGVGNRVERPIESDGRMEVRVKTGEVLGEVYLG
jgi:hypothetical protein